MLIPLVVSQTLSQVEDNGHNAARRNRPLSAVVCIDAIVADILLKILWEELGT